jgi:hypothetical protein
VINSSRSERGWRGRRRIAVLVSLAGVLGVVALGTAGTASAAVVANCKSKLEPKGNSSGTQAKLTFVCDGPVRAYTVAATSPIKSYSASTVPNFTCEGAGVGFGCGIADRAAPGTQVPGTTGWETKPPPPNAGGSNATNTPTTCNGFKRIQGAGTSSPGPNITAIVTPACSEIIPAGTKVTQTLKFKQSPCSGTQVNLLVGGEPPVTAFIAPTSAGPGGDSTTVGEYLDAPQPVSMKAYKHCLAGGSGGANGVAGAKKSGGATASAVAPTKFPVACGGTITPSTSSALPGIADLAFACSQNVRAFAIYSNVPIALPGDEPVVTGDGGGKLNESAIQQCQGNIPGPGYGCGTVDRQAQTTTLPNGNTLSAGNTALQHMAFESTPCKRKGQTRPKAWLVAMGEPTIGSTVGEFSSQPFPLAISGFKCKGGGGKKK